MIYIYKDNFAIGYLDGDREIFFSTPIPAHLLEHS